MSFIVLKTLNQANLEPPAFVPTGIYTAFSQGIHNVANYEFIEVLIETNQLRQLEVSAETTWVLKTDGTLWGTGYNYFGQQGSGDTKDVLTFTQRLTDVKEFSCFETTTWAIKNDGTLWGCGCNRNGEQGDNSTTDALTFTQRLTDVKKIIFSNSMPGATWAIKNDDTLWGCGFNEYGQQGSGNNLKVLNFTERTLG